MPMYLVRSSLPGASIADLDAATERATHAAARMGGEGFRIRYVHSTYVPVDGWFGSLYEADSALDVRLANDRAAIPYEDVVEVVSYECESGD